VYLLHIYAKNEQADMDPAGRKAAGKFVEELKRAKQESAEKKKPG
jgi:hypothetical protein